MTIRGLSLHQGNTESRKNLEKNFIFQFGTFNPHGINERFSFILVFHVAVLYGRLRVVSNFGDRDCGAGEIHTRERAKFRGDATREERQKFAV